MDSTLLFKNKLAIIGVLIALLGIGVAIFQEKIRSSTAPEATSLKVRVMHAGAILIGEKGPEVKEKYDWITYSYMALGFLGLVFGVLAFLRHESLRHAGMSVALGLIAIAWEYVVVAIVIGVVILIIVSIISNM